MSAEAADSKAVPLLNPWPAVLAAAAANFVGVGLGRFAYAPLVPALVDEGWYSPASAAYLGAANLAGYLGGALLAGRIAARTSHATLMRLTMIVSAVSFLACAAPISFAWFFLWRFLAGASGAVLMVLAATTVLARVPSRHAGKASGLIFAGVGLGIAASGTLVPPLLSFGLPLAWLGLGALSLLLTAVAWRSWPPHATVPAPVNRPGPVRGLGILCLCYGLNAAGIVPHMVFLVDFVARGLRQGLDAGASYWILFGLGAAFGPVLTGTMVQRIGSAAALRVSLVVQALFVAALVADTSPTTLVLSSLVIGALVPGIVPVVLGRVRELVPGDENRQKAAWGACTIAFAVGQAAGAYALSYVFAATGGDYAVLFGLGAIAIVLGLVADFVARFGASSPAARREL